MVYLRKLKSFYLLQGLTLLAVFLVAGCGQTQPTEGMNNSASPAAENEPYRIGAVFSQSGPAAPLGEPFKKGMELAIEEINGSGGINGRELKVVSLDDQSKPDVAVSQANRLITQDKVLALIGGSNGSTANAIAPTAERQQITFLTPTGMTLEEQKDLQYSYFFLSNFTEVSHLLLGYLQDIGASKVGLLRLSREYGQVGSANLHALQDQYDIEIVAEEQGNDSDTDFTSQLTKIRAASPDALILWLANPAGAIAMQNMQQLAMELPIVGPTSLANRATLEMAKGAAEGIVVQTNLSSADPLPRQQAFVEAFRTKYNYEPENFEAIGYDIVKVLAQALQSLGGQEVTPAVLQQALDRTAYEGVGAIVSFAPGHHEPERESMVLVKVENGEFVLVK